MQCTFFVHCVQQALSEDSSPMVLRVYLKKRINRLGICDD